MKCSIVTISYNQAEFIERTIKSVIAQRNCGVDIEYIIVDPGSTDGSRDIINKYEDQIDKIIFEKDDGPANGLNIGFAAATGEIYGFLNSDDILYPGVIAKLIEQMTKHEFDVISANSYLIDKNDNKFRKLFSDKFSLLAAAYGASILIQPSTLFTGEVFHKVSGFNEGNRSNWDGELFIDFAIQGAQFGRSDLFASGYRLHDESITGTKKIDMEIQKYHQRIFNKILNRNWGKRDFALQYIFKIARKIINYKDTKERLLKGKSYGRLS